MKSLTEKHFTNGKNPRDYKGYIFDLDGTLLDSKQDLVDATNATIVAMGGEALEMIIIEPAVGRSVRDLIVKTLNGVPGIDAKQALAYFNEYYLQNGTKHSRFYKGSEDFLDFLKNQNKLCAILTNKPQIYADDILQKLALSQKFDFVLGAENGFAYKPDPSGFLAIAEAWKLKPQEILYFGDSEVDAETAQNAGCDLAMFLEGYIPEPDLAPYYDFATVAFRDYQKLHNHFEAAFR